MLFSESTTPGTGRINRRRLSSVPLGPIPSIWTIGDDERARQRGARRGEKEGRDLDGPWATGRLEGRPPRCETRLIYVRKWPINWRNRCVRTCTRGLDPVGPPVSKSRKCLDRGKFALGPEHASRPCTLVDRGPCFTKRGNAGMTKTTAKRGDPRVQKITWNVTSGPAEFESTDVVQRSNRNVQSPPTPDARRNSSDENRSGDPLSLHAIARCDSVRRTFVDLTELVS